MCEDHNRLEDTFEEFRKISKTCANEARLAFLDFKIGLQRHIGWEEEILFPIFERRTGMRDVGPTAVMRMEHRQIEKLLDEIAAKILTENQEFGELEVGLLELLGSHNQKEENILYPAIDDLMSDLEKEQAIERMTEPPVAGKVSIPAGQSG